MFCQTCKKRSTCTEICKELENYLAREQSKDGYSDRHIRRIEIPYAPDKLDFIAEKAIKRRFGGRKNTKYSE